MNQVRNAKLLYGCGVWNSLNSNQVKELNELKPNLLKRILEVPYSTPSSIVKYEFGIIDTELNCLVEKVVLVCNTINKQGLGEKLLSSMLVKNVPGLCVEVKDAMDMLEIDKNCDLLKMEGKKLENN